MSDKTATNKYFTREEAIMGGDAPEKLMSREEAILAGQKIKAFTRKEALRTKQELPQKDNGGQK